MQPTTAVVNVNGRITSGEHAVVSVFDHGFLYGEGVYETIRTYNGRPFLFDKHMLRLRKSAALIDLRVPFTDEDCFERTYRTLHALNAGSEAYIRILLTRGVGELSYDPAACAAPTVVIITKPHVGPPPHAYDRGVSVALVSVLRNHPESVSPIIKSNNLLNNALAMQEALRKGAFEALMRNYRSELTECSQSNFFLVRDGSLLTPPVDAGLLEGVTRNFVMAIAEEIGVPVQEAVLFEHDLERVQEAFLTSTTRELVPIVQIDARQIGSGRPGPLTRRLLDEFRRRADALTRSEAGRGPANPLRQGYGGPSTPGA